MYMCMCMRVYACACMYVLCTYTCMYVHAPTIQDAWHISQELSLCRSLCFYVCSCICEPDYVTSWVHACTDLARLVRILACMCSHLCVRMYVFACMFACMCSHLCVRMYVFARMFACVCVCVCVYACMLHVYGFVCMCV